MKESLEMLKGLFDFMDELDEMSIKNTGKPSPYRPSPEAEKLKNIVQAQGDKKND